MVPRPDDSLATYDVKVSVPDGWASVTQGTVQSDPTHWIVSTKSEALTVVANRFVVKTRPWKAQSGQALFSWPPISSRTKRHHDEYLDTLRALSRCLYSGFRTLSVYTVCGRRELLLQRSGHASSFTLLAAE